MKSTTLGLGFLAGFLVGFICGVDAQAPPQNAAGDLGGTSWQLVKFVGSDDKTLTPEDKSKYTIAFGNDGNVSVRIDCNRGRGTWKSSAPNQLEFGPLALTRAFCPPGALNDQIPKQWQYVRSFTLKDGHLFLALMADGGIYEYEPLSPEGTAGGVIKGSATYRERMALPPSAVFEATLEDVSRADASPEIIGRARIEHPGNPPIPFEITYDVARIAAGGAYSIGGRITDGDRLLFLTTQGYPVLTRGNGNQVKLLLRRSSASPAPSSASSASSLSGLPGTFVGTLPCADCPGIRYQLNLSSDHTFVSRMSYEQRDVSVDHHGHWQLASDGKILVLQEEGQAPQKFAVRGVDTLRKVDLNGHEVKSKLNYDLKRTAQFEPIELRGETTTASLENTYWKLTDLGDTPVTAASQQQEPHFVLNSETHRVSGSGGCNRLTGGYELQGEQLAFTQMAGTLMACVKGMDTEKAFLDTLAQVKTWKITGQQLDLFDPEGKPIARFSAVYMK